MTSDDRIPPDLSRACWRCAYWGGLVERVHAKCARADAPLQASPATGCAYWTGGADDSLPPDWMPIGFKVPECHGVWGTPVPMSERPAIPLYERPTNRSDAFAFDQKLEAGAWAAADALMARARAR